MGTVRIGIGLLVGVFCYSASGFAETGNDGAADSQQGNTAPVAFDGYSQGQEDGGPVTLTFQGSDADGDALTFRPVSDPAFGELQATNTGYVYVPEENFSGNDHFTYVAYDGAVDSEPAKYKVSLAPVNDPPIAEDIYRETSAGEPDSFTLIGGDPADGVQVDFRLVSQPASGQAVRNDSWVTYTPADGFTGTVTFEYVANDGTLDSAPATIEMVVLDDGKTDTNEPPAFTSTPITHATQSALYRYDAEASDPDDDPFAFRLVQAPHGMTVDHGTGVVEWTPEASQTGAVDVVLELQDAAGFSVTQIFTINVVEAGDDNRAPTITSTPVTQASEGTPYSYAVTASDPDAGDALSFALVAGPSGMAIDAATGAIQWTPAAAQVGDHAVTVQVADAAGLTDSQSYTLSVTDTNEAPAFTSSPVLAATAGSAYSYAAAADDPDAGDSLGFTLDTAPAGMSVDPVTGRVSWTPGADQAGAHPIVLRVTDDAGLSATQSYTLEVAEPPNTAPSITSTPVTTATEDEPYSYEVAANDPDVGDTLTFALGAAPAGMSIQPDSGLIEWVPGNAQTGAHTVTARVEDGEGGDDEQTFTVTVDNVNQPPAISSTPLTVATEGEPYGYDVEASDPDAGDTLSFELSTAPSGMTVDSATGLVEWTPAQGQLGDFDVTVEVVDAAGETAAQSFVITVANTADAPSFVSTPVTTGTAGSIYSYTAQAEDPDIGDTLTYALNTAPSGMSIDAASGAISWMPEAEQAGSHPVEVSVSDSDGLSATQSYTLEVAELPNNAPTISSTPVTTATEGEPYSYAVQASDPDADDTLAFALDAAPAGMSIDSASGVIAWTPTAGQAGSVSVTLSVADDVGAEATQSFTISVAEAANTAPVFSSNPVTSATIGSSYAYDLEAEDADGDALTYSIQQGPNGISLDVDSGLLAWTPVDGQEGSHAVTVRVSDGEAFAEQSFTIAVSETALPLDVFVSVSQSVVDPGEAVTVTVFSEGGQGTVSLALTVNGTPVSLDSSNQAQITRSAVGAYDLVATATDSEQTVDRLAYFSVRDPDDADAPVAEIDTPEDGTEVTAPVEIVGTASDANLAEYRLVLTPADSNDSVEIGRGTTPVSGDVLGTFDPSQFANGVYRMGLVVTDVNGQQSSTAVGYTVSGDLKVGSFSFTVTDLTVPVAGMPIQVQRTYDTRRKHESLDFGHGWSVGYQDVRVQENRTPGLNWQQTSSGGLIPTYCIEPVGPHYVTVTLPNGEVEEFDLGVTPDCQQLSPPRFVQPTFTARPGTDSTLEVISGSDLELNGGELFDMGTLTTFDPSRYRLTTRDGTELVLDQDFGIRTITEPNGNTITFSDSGIQHSAGVSIDFTRDSDGRITEITDPEGNAISYEYNVNGDLVSVTNREGEITRHRYNRSHGLTEYIDPRGFTPTRNIYDDDGRLIATEDADGNRVEYSHDVEGRQEIVRDRRGNATTYVYDDDGNVVQETNALGETVQRSYDDQGELLSETNALGHTTTYSYNDNGDRLTETNALGETRSFTYDTAGRQLTETDPAGNVVVTNAYDGNGNPVENTDALGNTTQFDYDSTGNLTSTTDPLGNDTTREYDASGNLTRKTDTAGNVTEYTYDANGNRLTESTTRTRADGTIDTLTTSYVYDAEGRVIETTHPDGTTTQTEYNALDKVAAEIDALGRRTEYEYDARGNKVLTRYPDGTTEARSYDAEGNLVAETDRAGRTTTMAYDAANRLVETTYPDGTSTRREYDAASRLTAEIDERGNRTEYEYDAAGRQVLVRDALGNETTYEYDTAGRRTATVDARGNRTEYVYDAAGRRIETHYPDGTSTSTAYDGLGRRISQTDERGRTTEYDYDAAGNLVGVTDALGHLTQYGYDEQGNKISQTDAEGRTTTWAYDNAGRVVSRTLPLGQTETFAYDAVGNRTSHTDFNGETTSYSYDALGREVGRDYTNDADVTTTYTATGEVASVTDGRGTTSYSYDSRDRLTRIDYPDGSYVEYGYDAAGNRVRLTTSHGETTYAFDAANRLAAVTDANGTTTYSYNAVGSRAGVSYPNGVETSYSYDSRNRLTRIETRDETGAVLLGLTYTLNDNGTRAQLSEDSGRVVDYTYDALDRLVEEAVTDAAVGNRTTSWSYDTVGNRLTETTNSAAGTEMVTYSYDANDRLQSETGPAGTTTSDYDANGNLTQRTAPDGTVTYTWNDDDRLVGADDGSQSVSYTYDVDGIRQSQSVDGVATDFLVDPNRAYAEVIAEEDASGNALVRYTHADELVAQTRAGMAAYYHADGLGSTRLLTNAAGSATDSYVYEAFGETEDETGSTENGYRFTGEMLDDELGLYYLRARYMDPGVGRFVGMDPWSGLGQRPRTLHKYVYAGNDPIKLVDPTGYAFGLSGIGASLGIRSTLTLSALSGAGGFLFGDGILNRGNYHEYESDTFICSRSTMVGSDPCDFNRVSEGLHRFPAPFMSGIDPVRDGETSFVSPFGPVVHEVSSGQVRNVTLEGHWLYPGFVDRTVEQRGRSIYVNTYGEGSGRFPLLNSWLSDPLWSMVDYQIRNYVSGGYFAF